MYGVDYAWTKPNLDTLWNSIVPGTNPAQHPRFVSRYLAYNGTNGYAKNGKVLTRLELVALHTRGFAVMLNWEQAAGDMFQGYNKGVEHAREALRQANALGAPGYIPIYFSCDKDTTEETRKPVARYLDGCADVLGRQRVGVYGEADVINAMVPTHALWGWETYAWSGGAVSSKAHVYQYKNGVRLANVDLDLNRTLQTNFGAWAPNSAQVEVIQVATNAELAAYNADSALYALNTDEDNYKAAPAPLPAGTATITVPNRFKLLEAKVQQLLDRPVTNITPTPEQWAEFMTHVDTTLAGKVGDAAKVALKDLLTEILTAATTAASNG